MIKKSIHKLYVISLYCFLIGIIVPFINQPAKEYIANAGENPEIIVINSDASVEKYLKAQKEFRNTVSYPVFEINLNEEKWGISSIEALFWSKRPNLVYCIGTKACAIAEQYGKGAKILFTSVTDKLRMCFSPKYYGVVNELHPEMQILMFRFVFPNIQNIGVLCNKELHGERFMKIRDQAEKSGINIVVGHVSNPAETLEALNKILPDIDALWLFSDINASSEEDMLSGIFKICHLQQKPVFADNEAFAEYGAVLIVSPDDPTMGRQAAAISMDILDKKRIDNKIQYPAGTNVILNLKKVKEYGLKYCEDAIASVNEVVE